MEPNLIIHAARDGNLQEVQRLIQQRDNRYTQDQKDLVLIAASRGGHLLIVEYLLIEDRKPPRANIHARQDNPLASAAYQGHLRVVEFLVNHGADIHTQNDLPLVSAATNGYLSIVEFLISRGADIHAKNDRALVEAARYEQSLVIKYLLNHGANINVLSPNNQIKYQNWVTVIISVDEYYRLEPDIEEIEVSSNRYILLIKDRSFIL